MKVTALIPDDLINTVQELAQGKNLTESLVKALQDWSSTQNLKKLTLKVKKRPLKFNKTFSAEKIRSLNRNSW
jgi:hypothetical protein